MNKSLIEIEKCNCDQSLALEKELFDAKQINEAYALEIRNRPDLMKEGFCQGTIFKGES